jgi:AraC family transcriptional regulator
MPNIFVPGKPFADTVLQDLDIDPTRVNLRYESIAHDPLIEQIAERILGEMAFEISSGRLLVESLSNTLSAHLVHKYSETDARLKVAASVDKPLDERRLSRVIEFVDARIRGELAVSDMARTACLSPAHFARSFKATTGRTPHEFVSERRLDLAKQMLEMGSHSTAEIAYATGFSSQANFARAFRRVTNVTPSQYRAQQHKRGAG